MHPFDDLSENKKIHSRDDGHDLELQLTERNLNKWEDVGTYSFQANPHPDLQITHGVRATEHSLHEIT